jgi:hypothetical protein
MTTVIEENQLNAELQELYLISKRWVSDLEFFARDLSFLHKQVQRCYSQLKKHEVNENLLDVKLNVSNLQVQSNEIARKVTHYISQLERRRDNANDNYELDLIETHSILEREIGSLLQTFKSVKQRVFKLTSERIKANNLKTIK